MRTASVLVVLGLAACERAHRAPPPDMPRHGVMSRVSGLGATGPVEDWFRFDADTRILLSYEGPAVDGGEVRIAHREVLAARGADALWQHALAVLHGRRPATQDVTDYLLRFVIRNDDEVLDVTAGGPFASPSARDLQDELAHLADRGQGADPSSDGVRP